MKHLSMRAIKLLCLGIMLLSAIVCAVPFSLASDTSSSSATILANELQVARKVEGALARAEAHIRSGKLRLRGNHPENASYEFDKAQQILDRDVKPALNYTRQVGIQGGMVLMGTQLSSLNIRVQKIEWDIERSGQQIHTKQQPERYERALRESQAVLQPIGSATTPYDPYYSFSRQYFPQFRDFEAGRWYRGKTLEDDIQRNIDILQRQGRRFRDCLLRADRFFPQVTSILAYEGVPEVLAYVALLESGYQPEAKSSSGKAGLWQFSSSNARRYGLRVTRSYDERLLIDASTRAFARYLTQRYREYGNWVQAVAALSPKQDYLARFLAAVRIANAPREYGFHVDLYHMTGRCDLLREDSRSYRRSEPDFWEPPAY